MTQDAKRSIGSDIYDLSSLCLVLRSTIAFKKHQLQAIRRDVPSKKADPDAAPKGKRPTPITKPTDSQPAAKRAKADTVSAGAKHDVLR